VKESGMKDLSVSQKQLGFNIHAIVFVPTMALLAVVNVLVGPPYWVLWVLLSWGVGLLMHWLFGRGESAKKIGLT
jgi:2TM domain